MIAAVLILLLLAIVASGLNFLYCLLKLGWSLLVLVFMLLMVLGATAVGGALWLVEKTR